MNIQEKTKCVLGQAGNAVHTQTCGTCLLQAWSGSSCRGAWSGSCRGEAAATGFMSVIYISLYCHDLEECHCWWSNS